MTAARHLSPDTRAGALVALGTSLLLAPIALGLADAAMATGVVIGALAIGLGVAGTAVSGRGTIPVSAHMAYDRGLAVGLLLSGAAFGVVGEPGALAFFAAAGVFLLIVGAVTRYSVAPSQDFLS